MRYRVWARDTDRVEVQVWTRARNARAAAGPGGHRAITTPWTPRARRRSLQIPPRRAGTISPTRPRAGSRRGCTGRSMVIDPRQFAWQHPEWSAPAFRDLVIYELHIGTFTPEGTFLAAIEKLPHVRDLGATAIEIMPIADFAGRAELGLRRRVPLRAGPRLRAPGRSARAGGRGARPRAGGDPGRGLQPPGPGRQFPRARTRRATSTRSARRPGAARCASTIPAYPPVARALSFEPGLLARRNSTSTASGSMPRTPSWTNRRGTSWRKSPAPSMRTAASPSPRIRGTSRA